MDTATNKAVTAMQVAPNADLSSRSRVLTEFTETFVREVIDAATALACPIDDRSAPRRRENRRRRAAVR
jgi:hypothetical protein